MRTRLLALLGLFYFSLAHLKQQFNEPTYEEGKVLPASTACLNKSLHLQAFWQVTIK